MVVVVAGDDGASACVELGVVSARRRVGVGVFVNFAPERSLGRQPGTCWLEVGVSPGW